jgi:hypothetical protein
MKPSEFPLDKTDRRLSELCRRAEQSPAVYRYVESPSAESAAAASYDSLLDYWHILFRHRVTLLRFALGGLLAAIMISLVPRLENVVARFSRNLALLYAMETCDA